MKLISSIDNGKRLSALLQLGEIDYKQYYIYRTEHDDFLELPPHPSQFVAMDDYGNVLERQKEHLEDRSKYYEELEIYQQAQSKVLFEGFYVENDKEHYKITNGNVCVFYKKPDKKKYKLNSYLEAETISDLIPYNLTLTATAQKIIGV